jgi:hypothetical protein
LRGLVSRFRFNTHRLPRSDNLFSEQNTEYTENKYFTRGDEGMSLRTGRFLPGEAIS